MIEPIGRSVLDAPPSRGMTTVWNVALAMTWINHRTLDIPYVRSMTTLGVATDLCGKFQRAKSQAGVAQQMSCSFALTPAYASFFGVYFPSTHL